jgi:hypothetical protein
VGSVLRSKGLAKQAIFACVAGLALSTGVGAAEVEFAGQGTVRITGTITDATEESFYRLLDQERIRTVELDSGGGQVYAALGIADRIHKLGINTWVMPGAKCYSACSLIFLAGEMRLADGLLGVHQIRSGEQNNSLTQAVVADIFAALSSYGTPDELVAVMLRTPPEEMYVFTPEEIDRLGVTRRQGEVTLSHLQVVESTLYDDWLVGTFLNTHTAQPFYALESRDLDPVLRIVHYPGRNQTFGEIIWSNRTFSPGKTDLRFVFERDANEFGAAGTFEVWARADLEALGYSWDFPGDQESVNFMNGFIYGHRLMVEDFSRRTIAQFGLSGSYKATKEFIALMER